MYIKKSLLGEMACKRILRGRRVHRDPPSEKRVLSGIARFDILVYGWSLHGNTVWVFPNSNIPKSRNLAISTLGGNTVLVFEIPKITKIPKFKYR